MTRHFPDLEALARAEGTELGQSGWLQMTQERINTFAEGTNDFQWIHVDPEKTQAELGMKPIAHGFLTLSLMIKFYYEIVHVESVKRIINYGCDKVRFLNMVPVDSEIRGRVFLTKAVLDSGILRAHAAVTVDIKDSDKPALAADTIMLFYE